MTLTARAAAREEVLLTDPLYQRARERIVALVRAVVAAGTVDEFNAAHRSLLIEYAARQKATDATLPERRADANEAIRSLSAQTPRPLEAIRAAQHVRTRVAEQEHASKSLRLITRVIADGLVWRALDFERIAFAVLGHGRRVGKLAVGAGWQAEVAALGALLDSGSALVVHNDLTTCLRHGDVTTIEIGTSPRNVSFAEIKAGGHADPGQAQRLDDALALLRSGYHPTINAGQPLRIAKIDAPYQAHVSELAPVVAEARDRIAGWKWLRPWLAVGAIDLRAAASNRTEYERLMTERNAAIGSRFGPFYSLTDRRIRERHDNDPWLVPIALLPLSAEDVADALMGYIEIFSFIDIAALGAALDSAGIVARFARGPLTAHVFFQADLAGRSIVVPATLREQMLAELMSLDSLVDLIKHLANVSEERVAPGEAVMIAFADEGAPWKRTV